MTMRVVLKEQPLADEVGLVATNQYATCMVSFRVVDRPDEGNFDLVILLRNTVGKEFTVVERKIEVQDLMAGPPQVIGPFVGYQINTYDQAIHLPYKVLDQKLVVDPKEIKFDPGRTMDLHLFVIIMKRDPLTPQDFLDIGYGGDLDILVGIPDQGAPDGSIASLGMANDPAKTGKGLAFSHGSHKHDDLGIRMDKSGLGGRKIKDQVLSHSLLP